MPRLSSKPKPAPEPLFISIKDAVGLTGLSIETVKRMVTEKVIPTYRPVKGRVLIMRSELIEFIKSTAYGKNPRRGGPKPSDTASAPSPSPATTSTSSSAS